MNRSAISTKYFCNHGGIPIIVSAIPKESEKYEPYKGTVFCGIRFYFNFFFDNLHSVIRFGFHEFIPNRTKSATDENNSEKMEQSETGNVAQCIITTRVATSRFFRTFERQRLLVPVGVLPYDKFLWPVLLDFSKGNSTPHTCCIASDAIYSYLIWCP